MAVPSEGGSPEAVTIRSFSFWWPVPESVLVEKLNEVLPELGYDRWWVHSPRGPQGDGYESEEVSSLEVRGIGFYRWDVLDRNNAEIGRIDPDYVMRPLSGEEVRWRYH